MKFFKRVPMYEFPLGEIIRAASLGYINETYIETWVATTYPDQYAWLYEQTKTPWTFRWVSVAESFNFVRFREERRVTLVSVAFEDRGDAALWTLNFQGVEPALDDEG